ncbi:MAG TPA: S8 family serine peptidase [Candidatus Methylomirabilis sp.]|nr:S8 family serine peptidase [Candidatus Methylomirabilis sp.]
MEMTRCWAAAMLAAFIAIAGAAGRAEAKDGQNPKIRPALSALYAEHAAAALQNGVAFVSRNTRARLVDDRVVVDAIADGDDGTALEAELAALGMKNRSVFGRVVSGELPISSIPSLAGVKSLRFARPSYALRRTGSVTSQGDHAIGADAARANFGVSGAGVQVGALSDSFNCLGGAAADIASGDLSPVTVIQEIGDCNGATDEGRAILQIVHDVAPGSSLSFASAFNGEASFANNIIALQSAGARVILDDIVYIDEPFFQDGILAQAVDTVVARGAAFFSAAGNYAREGYESGFNAGAAFAQGHFPSLPGAPPFFGGIAHNFASSGAPVYMQPIIVPAGSELTISFQWDSPFFSVSGGAGSPNDLDIYLLNAAGTAVVAASVDDNLGGDPIETIDFTNSGPTAIFNLMIVSFAGPFPGFMKYIQLGSTDITIAEFNTFSGTVFGHTNAAGGSAVGAAFWEDTPAFGVNPPLLESYSSAGPTPILFDTAGNRLATPVVRLKPDIVAPDGVSTTFFGQRLTPGGPLFFFGTSAATPHAAGTAALLLERQPEFVPSQVYQVLNATTIDMETPGFDFDTGFGFVQANSAVGFVSVPQPGLGLALSPSTLSAGQPFSATVSLGNLGAATAADFYFVVLVPPAVSASVGCPANDAIVFLTNGFASFTTLCTSLTPIQDYPALFKNVPIAAGQLPFILPDVLNGVWSAGAPPGTYTFAVFITPPNAFASGTFTPSDITALATATLQVVP